MSGTLLTVEQLRIALPTARGPAGLVRGLDFSLQAGESLGLIGESGCGKSLTALALMGLLPAAARVQGCVRFEGQDLLTLDEPAWCRVRGRRIAMVFQEPMTALNPLHRIARQVAEPLRLHEGLAAGEARERAAALLQRVGLDRARLDAYPHQLSGGQRQRVAIAIALACRPALLIADEPTTALDAGLRLQILALLRELSAERGMALLLISHDLALIARSVQRLLVMYAGRIVEQGPAAAVLDSAAHPYTRGLLAARPRAGQRGQRLAVIPGVVPAAGAMPEGCAFGPRCAHAAPVCAQDPALLELGGGHGAACLRLDEIARHG